MRRNSVETARHSVRRIVLRTCAGASVAVLLLTSGCKQASGPSVDNGICGHIEFAGGVDMVSHGSDVFHQFGFQTTGNMSVVVGAVLHGIDVTFLDENALPIHLANDCGIMRMDVEMLDSTLADITRDAGLRWRFNVVGKKAGRTTLTVALWHDGHAHFTSEPITLTVVAPAP